MANLEKKTIVMRKAQTRLDRMSKTKREVQLNFRRVRAKNGQYYTCARFVLGTKRSPENVHGVFHKAGNLRYRVTGDIPSPRKYIAARQPRTVRGRLCQDAALTAADTVNVAGRAVSGAVLGSETAVMKGLSAVGNAAVGKVQETVSKNADDDFSKGTLFVAVTALDALKGTKRHFKARRRTGLDKARYKFKKAEYSVFVEKNRHQMTENRNTRAAAKRKYRKYRRDLGTQGGVTARVMVWNRKREYRQIRRETDFADREAKTEGRYQRREYRNLRRIQRAEEPGLLVLRPVGYSARKIKESVWQKTVSADESNDVMRAVDSAKRYLAEPAERKISKPERLKRAQKRSASIQKHKLGAETRLAKQESRLQTSHDAYRRKYRKAAGQKSGSARNLEMFKLFAGDEFARIGQVLCGTAGVGVLLILLVFAMTAMFITSFGRQSAFAAATYAADNQDLSRAERYYTKLVWEMNEHILQISGHDDWKDGLRELGADTSDMPDKPVNWYWGNSAWFAWEPVCDFDCDRLWSFLCAYYYDFSDDSTDISYWKYSGDTEELLEELFDAEYDFVYKYQNGSHWKVRDSFEQTEGYNHFNSCTRDEDGRFWIELEAVPEPLSAFASEQNLCFDLANGEILNANDGFRATGWYLQNQYIDIMDNAGNVFAGWSDYSDLEPAKYQFGDAGQFEVPYLIWTAEHQWVRFLREYDWVTDCDLYYSVRKNKTFEQVLRDKLSARDNGAARVEYYDVLLRYDGENAMFGNHQVFPSMLPGESFREYGVRQTFGYEIEGWNRESEEPYEGIELSCAVSTPVSAPFDCVISDADGDSAVLAIEDVMYPFDGSEGRETRHGD